MNNVRSFRIKAMTTIYYCVYHSVMRMTIRCSNAKDNIHFVIIFLQLLRNDLSLSVTLFQEIMIKIDFQKIIT